MTQEERQKAALNEMREQVLRIAKEFKVCPLCLIYNTASGVEQAEEAGLLRHFGDGHEIGIVTGSVH